MCIHEKTCYLRLLERTGSDNVFKSEGIYSFIAAAVIYTFSVDLQIVTDASRLRCRQAGAFGIFERGWGFKPTGMGVYAIWIQVSEIVGVMKLRFAADLVPQHGVIYIEAG